MTPVLRVAAPLSCVKWTTRNLPATRNALQPSTRRVYMHYFQSEMLLCDQCDRSCHTYCLRSANRRSANGQLALFRLLYRAECGFEWRGRWNKIRDKMVRNMENIILLILINYPHTFQIVSGSINSNPAGAGTGTGRAKRRVFYNGFNWYRCCFQLSFWQIHILLFYAIKSYVQH